MKCLNIKCDDEVTYYGHCEECSKILQETKRVASEGLYQTDPTLAYEESTSKGSDV